MAEALIETFVSNLLSVILAGICGWFASKYKENQKEEKKKEEDNEILKKAVLVCIRRNLVNDSTMAIQKGWIELHIKDDMLEAYEVYKHLGGNGTVKGLIEQVNKLPHIPPNQ